MLEKYLAERKKKLESVIKGNEDLYEHNQITMVKLKEQIKNLKNNTDEATQIFSVVAREDNGFKRQEIDDIEKRIAICVSENKDYKQIIDSKKKELDEVNECVEEIKVNNISRENSNKNIQMELLIGGDNKDVSADGKTNESEKPEDNAKAKNERKFLSKEIKQEKTNSVSNKENESNPSVKEISKEELLNKLKLCKNIAPVDIDRVLIEIDNLIKVIDR